MVQIYTILTKCSKVFALLTVLATGHASMTLNVQEPTEVKKPAEDPQWQLFDAVYDNNLPRIQELIQQKKVSINCANEWGITPLISAVRLKRYEVAEWLLSQKEIEPNCVARFVLGEAGFTALSLAVQNNDKRLVELLLKSEKINVNQKNMFGETALYIAAELGDDQMVQLLMAHEKIDKNRLNSQGETLLHVASKAGHLPLVKQILHKNEVDVNARDDRGFTALHCAVSRGQTEIVRTLCSVNGVDVNTKTDLPAHFPLSYGRKNIHWGQLTPLVLAARKGDKEILETLLDNPKTDLLFASIGYRTEIISEPGEEFAVRDAERVSLTALGFASTLMLLAKKKDKQEEYQKYQSVVTLLQDRLAGSLSLED